MNRLLVQLAPWYLFAQGMAVPVWWFTLLTSGTVRDLFEMGEPKVLASFFFADMLLFTLSISAGLSMSVASRWSATLIALTLGALGYSTLMTFTWVGISNHGYLGILAMSTATLCTLICLLIERRERP